MILMPVNTMSLSLIFICGGCIGSFLNVVMIRLPSILYAKRKHDAQFFLYGTHLALGVDNLARPSSCPHCHQKLKFHHNLPLISFFILRGKCAFCQRGISLQYPVVEILSALLATFLCGYFGITVKSLCFTLLGFYLISLSVIDIRHFILPDVLSLSLLWIGLVLNSFQLMTTPTLSILGAVAGYGILWLIYRVFKMLTQKDGFGYGDFKLTAAIGAWFGLYSLPVILFTSSLAGICIALFTSLIRQAKKPQIPFGPALGIATIFYIFFGQTILQFYVTNFLR